ncbi:MAG: DNA-3-methyladenine glycosylase I [Magnetospirillum sp.]
MSGYCDIAPGHPVHGPYHDTEYGFPVTDEAVLFERLCLEVFQAGLSWLIVLKKRPALFRAFDGFQVDVVAGYGSAEIERLMADTGIIRNRRKIEACIKNARQWQELRRQHGSIAAWLAAHHPRDKAAWVKLFKSHFAFMGGEVVGEFLMSIGILPGAHRADCPIQQKIASLKPAWLQG